MEINQIITLSTAHIKEYTAKLLDTPEKLPIPVYPTKYGYFIYVNNIDDATEKTIESLSSDLLTCIHFALNNNCTWIQFDRDAKSSYPELIEYEWSDATNNHPIRKRISKKEYYLNIATAISKRSTCLRRHYGAVIVNNDEIISTGYNGSARNEKNCCDIYNICPRHNKAHNTGDYSDCCSVHAEQNALLSAARNELDNATLYLNGEEYDENGNLIPITDCEPCPICKRMIQNSGIRAVITPTKNIILRIPQP